MTGSQLKEWRKRLRLSQAKAAEALGCSRSAIQSWEGRPTERLPKWAALAVSAVSLNLPPYGCTKKLD